MKSQARASLAVGRGKKIVGHLATVAAVLALLVNSAPSFALVYEFSFNGAVTYVEPDFQSAGAPGIGTPASGFFKYDSSAIVNPGARPGEGTYTTPLLPFYFMAGPLQVSGVGQQIANNVGVGVSNNLLGGSEDHFSFNAFTRPGEAPVNSTTVGGYSLTQLGIALTDSTGTVFDSVALPTSLSISSFDDLYVRLFYEIIINDYTRASVNLDTSITSFSLAPVPLPPAFPLFVTGLGVMGWLGWRRKQKAAA